MITLLTTITTVLVVAPGALSTVYINERFQTGVRASGFGLGYSLAIVLPAFYVFYQAGLAHFMPFNYTVLVLVIVGALLIFVGAAWGPETKDVRFRCLLPFGDRTQEDGPLGKNLSTFSLAPIKKKRCP